MKNLVDLENYNKSIIEVLKLVLAIFTDFMHETFVWLANTYANFKHLFLYIKKVEISASKKVKSKNRFYTIIIGLLLRF